MTDQRPAHSPIGASTCERWWNCPGSVALLATLPPSGDTQYSARGTVAHMLGENQLRIRTAKDAIDLKGGYVFPHTVNMVTLDDEVGRSYVEADFEIEVTEDDANAVQVYLDTIDEYLAVYGLNYFQDLRCEVKFDLTHLDPDAFGTCDAVIVVPFNRIIVIDYKHGQGHVVEVDMNKQFFYYALGAYYAIPADERDHLAYVEVCVVQPRARHELGGVRSVVYPIAELMQFEQGLRDAIKRVRTGDPALAVGSHCKFCNAKPVCPAFKANIQKVAQLEFDRVDAQPLDLPKPSSLSPERLSHIIANAELLKSWASECIALGHRIAEAGQAIPGYKLVEKKANRRWKCEKDVQDAFELEFGDTIFTKKLRSPAQLEKLLKKRKAELEPYWETPSGGKTLVAENDIRKGVLPDAVTDFDVITP